MNSDINSLGKPNSSDSTGVRGRRDLIAICVFAVVLVVFLTVFRYRSGDIEYWNSDATWHTLLTVRCYDEAPISQHLFLPIVTMGGEETNGLAGDLRFLIHKEIITIHLSHRSDSFFHGCL